MNKLAIFGSSGHAKDIASVQKEGNSHCEVFFIEPQGERETVNKLEVDGFEFIIGIGDNSIRKKVAQKYSHLHWANVISHQAHVPADLRLGRGLFIGFGVYLSYNVEVHDHAIIHCNSVIGHDTVIGKYAQIAPGVCIGGNGVTLGEGSFIGTNATVINKPLTIGEWSKIGLASVVTENIPPRVLYQTLHKKITLGI